MFGSEWVLPVRIDRHRRDAALRVNKIRFGQPTPAATSTSRSSQAAPGQPSPIVISVLRQELCAVERLRQRDEMVARGPDEPGAQGRRRTPRRRRTLRPARSQRSSAFRDLDREHNVRSASQRVCCAGRSRCPYPCSRPLPTSGSATRRSSAGAARTASTAASSQG